jgi:erythromycin esterase-like protein
MSQRTWRTSIAVLACLVGIALAATSVVTRGQERAPDAIVDRLVAATCDTRVVMLGELPSHGEVHAFDAKSRVVDRLIAQCGFTAVLFEAPVYDFVGLARVIEARTATQEQLDNAIGRFWWTRELAPWRRSLLEAAVARRVTLGGLDDQVSITSRYARATLPSLVASALPAPRAAECRDAVDRHLNWTCDAAHPFDDAERHRLRPSGSLQRRAPPRWRAAQHARSRRPNRAPSNYGHARHGLGAARHRTVALRGLGQVPSRLLGGVRAATWADSFDAVVVIGEEVAPTFDPWK